MSRELITCSKCNKKANHHDELGQEYCEKCYWEKDELTKEKSKKRSFKTYAADNATFLNCPYCGHGDTCGYDKRGNEYKGTSCHFTKRCGFFHPESNRDDCQTCDRIKAKESEEKGQKQHDKWSKIVDETDPLTQKESNELTNEDYKKIKFLQKEVSSLLKEIGETDLLLKSFVEDSQNILNELEQQFLQRDKDGNNANDNRERERTKGTIIREFLPKRTENNYNNLLLI